MFVTFTVTIVCKICLYYKSRRLCDNEERKGARQMEAKKRLLTYAGLKALEDELENLKVVKDRKSVV